MLSERLRSRFQKLFCRKNWSIAAELVRANLGTSDLHSALGMTSSLLSSGLMALIMYLLFKRPLGAGIKTYPLYLYTGIVFLNFFMGSTSSLSEVFFKNRALVQNSSLCREIIIISDLSVPIFKFIVEVAVCLILGILYRVLIWKHLIFLMPLLMAYMLFAAGAGLLVSVGRCFTNDVRYIWNIILRILYFATPIFYILNIGAGSAYRLLYFVNPLIPFLNSFRWICMGGNISFYIYIHAVVLGMLFFMLGYLVFIIFENIAVEQA